ncbi:MarR family winged helix-turn-helix transcriptional regulator [Senegalia massiliensis]|uniref:MarR family transcriptional regulator n=1 Tax=Senegalia massiliensis TaxID=1720316 RepID=A0A845R2U8_9CLOT|nr:MarR family transcriptional regulator [Senegalia massiliensis]NBI08016.1 MarR family transcriptional regulator [Senegalia massiliensis]
MNETKVKLVNSFIAMIEKVANGNINILDFGSEDMTFYRGEIHILKKIGDELGVYSSEIARDMGVTRAVIHKTVKKLENRGLVYKLEDDLNKRRKKLYLTEKGKYVYKLHEEYHEEHDKAFFDFIHSLNREENQLIMEFLKRSNELMDKYF